ncbi:phosphatase PAP2 family protein [Actinoplanes sp. NPDC051494]|uniref:phosphatase PAP2 family protein n=1 Tax=Actinoplanes sp. NPDC051494 TaxID=3363907 RepID=UPI0037AD615E
MDSYRDVVEFAGHTPGPVQAFMSHYTELGLLVLVALWALAWALTRRTAPALTGLAGVLLAYGLSEWVKTWVDAERPCRIFPELRIIAHECPATGDWSFPSNHSTIAGALVVAVLLLSRNLGLLALPLGVLAAFSRVFVGVHYPRDVVAGFLLGAAVTLSVSVLVRHRPGRRESLAPRRGTQPAGPHGRGDRLRG